MAAAGSAVASYAFAQVEAHFRRGIRIDGERPSKLLSRMLPLAPAGEKNPRLMWARRQYRCSKFNPGTRSAPRCNRQHTNRLS